jgi:hypothetical protein
VIGGNSLSCGNGGDSGQVTLTNSSYGEIINTPGSAENSGCPSSNKQSGSRINPITSGVHTSQAPSTNTGNQSGSTNLNYQSLLLQNQYKELQRLLPFISPNFTPNQIGQTRLPNVLENFQAPGPFNLTTVPTNLIPNLNRFVFTPLSDKFQNMIPQTSQLLSSVNITKEQDIARISKYPELIENPENIGLFKALSGDITISTYLTYERSQETLAQLIKVNAGQLISLGLKISQNDLSETVTAEFQGQEYNLSKTFDNYYVVSIEVPNNPGRYILESNSSDIPLFIDVLPSETKEESKPWGIFNWLWRLLN